MGMPSDRGRLACRESPLPNPTPPAGDEGSYERLAGELATIRPFPAPPAHPKTGEGLSRQMPSIWRTTAK
jgi:hypothetical protein